MHLQNIVRPITELQAPLESIPGRFIGRARGCIEPHIAQLDASDAPAHEKTNQKTVPKIHLKGGEPPKEGNPPHKMVGSF